jgi:hypothetical protein
MAGALVAASILVGGVEGAGAATLRAAYRFQGDLASEVAGAPELVNIGQGNRFAVERVDGLGRHPVLSFPEGNGLSLATTGLVDPTNNSVVVVFRFAKTSGFRRILDLAGGTSDTGLYNLDGRVMLYAGPETAASKSAVLGDSYAQIALTNAAAPGGSEQATAYLNGVEVAAARISKGFDLGPAGLRFFKDNTSGPYTGEESSGAVSCVLVYDGTLTANEVSQVAGDPTLCPAPRPVPGLAKALVTDKPDATRSGHSIAVDTGLTVSCPIGGTACTASGRVDAAPSHGRTAAGKRLGVVRLSVPAGKSKSVQVRLSGRGASALRNAGTLRVRVSTEIKTTQGKTARAQQTGRIKAPQPPAFRSGTYTGVTSQGLPILIDVSRTAVRSVLFRWRGICGDGKEHTNTIVLRGRARVHRKRFSLGGQLDAGGSARVSGELEGVRASGTLSRTGASASGARCTVKRIRWHARTSSIETGTSG